MGQIRSTVNPPQARAIGPFDKWLVDPVTGAPIGIQNPNAGGEDGQFYPIPLTQAQIDSPTADMLADTKVTYALDVAPYTRYMSNGTELKPSGSADNVTLVKYRQMFYSDLIVEEPDIIIVSGQGAEIRVEAWPV